MQAPVPVFALGDDSALGLLYNLPPDATASDVRLAIQTQLTVQPFKVLGTDGRTPLQPMQEHLLRASEVWGANPQVKLKWTVESAPVRKSFCRSVVVWSAALLVLPLVVAAVSTVFSLGIGATTLAVAHLSHPSHRRPPAITGAVEASLDATMQLSPLVPPMPPEDYDHYLDTFVKVWQASLDALVNMIDTYATILCKMADLIVLTVKECVVLYLHVFQDCFKHALDPTLAPLLIGMAIVVFAGTALIVHVVMKDLRRFFPGWADAGNEHLRSCLLP
eukprot:TRINITY_DN58989_c0_g1_i1.p1 TRINITY_DN58989_c0_g1~~TRINITY_DN58989_c0_g1_i1.p1  ORF type:complete len:277 (-),score=26.12 TRINITY_DN58989_c0_g1_i1:269-1099(-)